MKTLILPQFPFLFPWALVCFLFLVSRRGKLETKAVSWAILPMRTLGNCRETKQPKTALSFHAVQPPLFPFLFPLDALAVNESAGTRTPVQLDLGKSNRRHVFPLSLSAVNTMSGNASRDSLQMRAFIAGRKRQIFKELRGFRGDRARLAPRFD